MRLVSHGRPCPCPLPLLLHSAEVEHGGIENLQAMPMCDHISEWLQRPQRVAYFWKNHSTWWQCLPCTCLSGGVHFLCFHHGTTAAPERRRVEGTKFLLRCNEVVFFSLYKNELITSFAFILFICSLKGGQEAVWFWCMTWCVLPGGRASWLLDLSSAPWALFLLDKSPELQSSWNTQKDTLVSLDSQQHTVQNSPHYITDWIMSPVCQQILQEWEMSFFIVNCPDS